MDSIHRSERNALAISIMDPVGQLEPRDEQKTKAEMSEKTKKEFLEKKAWELAIAPGKQFLMTGRCEITIFPDKIQLRCLVS